MATFVEREDASIRLQNLKIVESVHGSLQKVDLYKHKVFGHVLVINDELQHVEAWQSLYHEPLVHLPASFIRKVQTVLILGGGDLFAAHEVLKYSSVRRVDLVEHDENVLDLTRRYYPHADRVLSDKRFKITIGDARGEFEEKQKKYDLVINDCFDLAALSTNKSPYEALERRLTVEGVCSDVIYRHVFCRKTVQKSLSQLSRCSRVVLGLTTIPEYPGALHILTLWGRNRHLSQTPRSLQNKQQRDLSKKNCSIVFDYYDPRFRAFYLYIPPYVRAAIASSSEDMSCQS
jgi:spermidine synthase